LAAALVMPDHYHAGMALVAGAIAALGGWLLEALVGHAHKVVPFIMWSVLGGRGVATGHHRLGGGCQPIGHTAPPPVIEARYANQHYRAA
jgi:hypothetical protein